MILRTKKLISYFVGRIKEVALKRKEFKSILNKDEIKNWAKAFNDDSKETKFSVNNNPISYFLKMLEGNNGENILREFIKLLKKVFENNEKLNSITGFNKIKNYFEKPMNAEGLISTVTSFLAGLSSIKNGVEFIVDKGKEFLGDEKRYLLSLWIKFVNVLRKIINKNGFKEQYKEELKNLYDLFYNIIKSVFKDVNLETKESQQQNGGILNFLSSIIGSFITKTFKIIDIITPKTIKEWIEEYPNSAKTNL